MSLLNNQPFKNGAMIGKSAGIAIPNNTAANALYTLPIPLAQNFKNSSLASASGNSINILKNGKYQIAIDFGIVVSMNLAVSDHSRIRLTNGGIELANAYYATDAGFSLVVATNTWQRRGVWGATDIAATFTDWTHAAQVLTANCRMGYFAELEMNSGDVLSLTWDIIPGQSIGNGTCRVYDIKTEIIELAY
jgi:hypothetical protein